MPDYVPISAADAVTWSGYAEIAGGVAVLPGGDPPARALVAARRADRRSSPPTSTWRSTPPRSPPRASRRTGSRAGCSGPGCRSSRCSRAGPGARPSSSRAAGRRAERAGPASPRNALASAISPIASSTGHPGRERAQPVGERRADRAGALRVVDRPHEPGAHARPRARVVDPLLGGELLPRLLGGQRRGERLAADAELAGGAVERREEELLRDLLDALGRGPRRAARTGRRPGSARSRRRRRRGRRRRAATDGDDAPQATQRRWPLTAPPSSAGRARSGSGPRARTPAAIRNEALNAWVAALSTSDSISSRRSIVAARSLGIGRAAGSNAGPSTGTLSPSAAIRSAIRFARSSFELGRDRRSRAAPRSPPARRRRARSRGRR